MDKKAEKIVNEIEMDIYDRTGLGNEWDAIADDVKEEIREAWANIIREILK